MTLKKALLIGLVLEILICCAAGAFYFKFYIYTPTYSIRAMQKAMQTGDVEELQRRVDLDAIFQNNGQKLAQLVPQSEQVYGSLQNGSFAKTCQEEFLSYVRSGEWPAAGEITPESAFQDNIGLKTLSFRSLEYVYRDLTPAEQEKQAREKEQSTLDKALALGMSLINRYASGEEGQEAAKEEAEAAQADAGPITVTAGVRVYEPNLGDTYILKLKLQRQEDGSWRLYDVENYQEFAELLIKQNNRDYTRYKEKVRNIVTATHEKLAELKTRHPEQDMDWMIEARKIMEESNQQVADLKVPVAGAYLDHLLKERKESFQTMLDAYYDKAKLLQEQKEAKELAEKTAGRRKKSVYNEAKWNKRLSEADAKVQEAQKSWADNKAKLEAVVGSVIDRAAVAQTVAAMFRNNDDAAVYAANYQAQTYYPYNDAKTVKGDTNNQEYVPTLLDSNSVPEVSAYDQLNSK